MAKWWAIDEAEQDQSDNYMSFYPESGDEDDDCFEENWWIGPDETDLNEALWKASMSMSIPGRRGGTRMDPEEAALLEATQKRSGFSSQYSAVEKAALAQILRANDNFHLDSAYSDDGSTDIFDERMRRTMRKVNELVKKVDTTKDINTVIAEVCSKAKSFDCVVPPVKREELYMVPDEAVVLPTGSMELSNDKGTWYGGCTNLQAVRADLSSIVLADSSDVSEKIDTGLAGAVDMYNHLYDEVGTEIDRGWFRGAVSDLLQKLVTVFRDKASVDWSVDTPYYDRVLAMMSQHHVEIAGTYIVEVLAAGPYAIDIFCRYATLNRDGLVGPISDEVSMVQRRNLASVMLCIAIDSVSHSVPLETKILPDACMGVASYINSLGDSDHSRELLGLAYMVCSAFRTREIGLRHAYGASTYLPGYGEAEALSLKDSSMYERMDLVLQGIGVTPFLLHSVGLTHCEGCGFVVVRKDHELRCKVPDNGDEVRRMNEAAWLGDALHKYDVRKAVLDLPSANGIDEVLTLNYVTNIAQAEYLKQYRSDLYKPHRSVHHNGTVFEANYRGGFREQYMSIMFPRWVDCHGLG